MIRNLPVDNERLLSPIVLKQIFLFCVVFSVKLHHVYHITPPCHPNVWAAQPYDEMKTLFGACLERLFFVVLSVLHKHAMELLSVMADTLSQAPWLDQPPSTEASTTN
jgi:hypothetical protein